MAKKKRKTRSGSGNGANLGFEAKLWLAADKLRNNMDAAEYKHVVLGLIFLKYISDSFEEMHQRLLAAVDEGADPEDADEYRAENVFWVPPEARWKTLQDNARQPTIGKLVDEAMVAIERDNPRLKGVLPKDYARPALDKQRLGELIDLIGTIALGDSENRSKDLLGRVYEYFLSLFASAEGKKGGQFYTPRCVVRVLVKMLAPYKGRVYDPCCGSAGMFVQSERFVEEHGGRIGDIAVYGQESNPTTRRLALMNLAIRGIEGDLGPEHADTFRRDLHKDLKADYVLANPPFNDSDWHRNDEDVRWKYGLPPKGNANFAWVQHFIHHLSPGATKGEGRSVKSENSDSDLHSSHFTLHPSGGCAGFVLANGSMSSNQSGEGDIRRSIIEADLVDCMVALPGQLFYSTQIPVCLWFLARNKSGVGFQPAKGHPNRKQDAYATRDRRGETLFIDARKLGRMIDRVHRELTDEEIQRLADTYHAWQGREKFEIRGCAGVLPVSDERRNCGAWLCVDTRSVRRRGRARGRRRAVRGQDATADSRTWKAVCRISATGSGHQSESRRAWFFHRILRSQFVISSDMAKKKSKAQAASRTLIPAERVERSILVIRGEKVLLDADLAEMYGVETKALTRAVRRNLDRFPDDFMFQLSREEFQDLRRHFGTSSQWGGRRYAPYAFTEQGVAMLSTVLRSDRAVQVNIEIMRAFVRLRQMLASHEALSRKLAALENKYDEQFKVVFDAIRQLMAPEAESPTRRIGFHVIREQQSED